MLNIAMIEFAALKDPVLFRNVQVDPFGYGIFWNDDIDLSESELWLNGISESSETKSAV